MQVKKHLSLLLAFFVLVSNTGLAFNVHYCEGKIAAISSVFSKVEVCNMPTKTEKSCCAKKEVTHKKCCSDKKIKLENKTEKVVIKSISTDFDAFLVIANCNTYDFVFSNKTILAQNSSYYCNANAPPLYKLYCQFTLFG